VIYLKIRTGKNISILFLCIVAISILSSCKKDIASSINSNVNPTNHVAGIWPIEGSPELTITIIQDPNVLSWDSDTNTLTKWLEDETGVKLKFNFLPANDTEQKLNLELATNGDLGDIIWVNYSIPKGLQQLYGKEGILSPLQDLVENYTTNIKNQFETVEGAKLLSTTPDGNMYALPYVGNCYNCLRPELGWINKEFLELYGKGMPTTTDELYDYLKWVSENDANGNGLNDEIPWLSAKRTVWESSPLDFIMNSFTYKDQNFYFVDKDDMIHAAFAEDGWRHGLQYMNKAYKENLLDSSSFTNDINSFQALVALNEGRTVGFIPSGGISIFAPDLELRQLYINVPPLKGPDGFQFGFYQIFGQVSGQRYMIPEKSKNKEVAIRFLDFLYTEEAWMRFRRGIEDVDWKVPEGKLSIVGKPAKFELINDIWGIPTNNLWQILPPWALVTGDDTAALSSEEYDDGSVLYLAARAADDYVVPVEVPTFYYDESIASNVATWDADLKIALEQAAAGFITGSRDINNDAHWTAYLAELETYGLSNYLKVQQESFDEIWKGNYPHQYTKPEGFSDVRVTND
jgi:putative aldouronate transport system substrate-binding protein